MREMLNPATRKEDLLIRGTVIADEIEIQNLRCKIYLPGNPTDRVWLFIHPTEEQLRLIRSHDHALWRFSFVAESGDLAGDKKYVSAKQVYAHDIKISHWEPGFAEGVMTADAADLKIFFAYGPGRVRSGGKTSGHFWITPHVLLMPASIVESHINGNVNIRNVRTFKFTLPGGLSLEFRKHYLKRENEAGEEVISTKLVAEFETDDPQGRAKINDDLTSGLDDLLLLTSFAGRQRCAWVGWEVYDTLGHTSFYRKNITVPEPQPKHRVGDGLISLQDFDDFIRIAYPRFSAEAPSGLFRRSFYGLLPMPRGEATIESRFTSLYSALENLVLYFRRKNNLEFIFSSGEAAQWQNLRREMMKWLKQQPLLAGEEKAEQRKLVYENLAGLERISFSYAFQKFCEAYSVELNDLWPISDGREGWPLSKIRNKLVHGEDLGDHKVSALATATEHLQWALERMLLAVLGWDYRRSMAGPSYLSSSDIVGYMEWTTDRRIISA